jgi:integrase
VGKLRAAAQLIVMHAQAPQTRRAYASAWRHFSSWCREAGRDPLPASPDTLKLFLTAHLDSLAIKTLDQRIAAVVDKHRSQKLEPPYTYELRELMKGARRQKGTAANRKDALTAPDLRKICAELLRQKTALAIRDRAILTLGFAGMMRRSEIAALDLADIRFAPKGVAISIRRSKTDQEAHGREFGVFHAKHAKACPVRSMRAWLYLRGREPGPLFTTNWRCGEGTRRITPATIGETVKRCAKMIGLDATAYAGHSLRAGGITAAAEDGVPESLIMQRSGHRSVQTVTGYVRPASIFRTDILRRAM